MGIMHLSEPHFFSRIAR